MVIEVKKKYSQGMRRHTSSPPFRKNQVIYFALILIQTEFHIPIYSLRAQAHSFQHYCGILNSTRGALHLIQLPIVKCLIDQIKLWRRNSRKIGLNFEPLKS